jgi:hypothetical protein
MLFMALSGALMAAIFKPNPLNVVAGTLTAYLVGTGVLAVARTGESSKPWLVATVAAGAAATAFAWALGLGAFGRGNPGLAAPAILFAIVGTLGLAGDARVLRAGGIQGTPRLTRHLWRMGFALWIATSSFFLGQAKFLPAAWRAAHWNFVPPLLVLGVLVYWVLRVAVFRRAPGMIRPAR